ncbi:amidase [Arenibaculum pallidiluteum]|uniref:amidase n=1 Tax=Arenibaculum pallidiluteum TaxID=2812559 RepID=UPI001A970970|nr:amidase [Arenibaculum pallidiluteum]
MSSATALPSPSIQSQAADLAEGRTTSVALTEAALAAIEAAGGDGGGAFLLVDRAGALAQARASDMLRAGGVVPSPLAGIPLSVKDLFDVAGQVTAAGSRVLADAAPASQDAVAVARLRAAGAVLIGRTNMTEFAFSGLGLNPHYGTPENPAAPGRIPGGSSSGAGASVARGITAASVGSDTGGSVRIPAAFCGIVGFKPTQSRIPRDGAVPLSWSLDCVGPLGRTVACCALTAAAMAGLAVAVPRAVDVAGLRLAVPGCHLLDGMDATVAAAFERALGRLSAAGARVVETPMPPIDAIPALNSRGTLTASESYAWHRDLLARRSEGYDPRVGRRIMLGAEMTASDYIDLTRGRQALMAEMDALTRDWDAVLLPTVAVVPPRLEELAEDADYFRINALVLRNTSAWNFLERPAVSLPCASDGAPVGLMVVGKRGHDGRLLSLAAALEPVVA